MSGRKIDDHANWAGPAGKGMVCPEGAKTKSMKSAEGAGHIGMSYPDTEEAVHRDQEQGIKKAKAHDVKPGYRN